MILIYKLEVNCHRLPLLQVYLLVWWNVLHLPTLLSWIKFHPKFMWSMKCVLGFSPMIATLFETRTFLKWTRGFSCIVGFLTPKLWNLRITNCHIDLWFYFIFDPDLGSFLNWVIRLLFVSRSESRQFERSSFVKCINLLSAIF